MGLGDLQTGQEVRFQLRDLICPQLEQVLAQIGPETDVSGRVVFLSDRGQDKDHFAIVSADGIASPLIVPVERLRLLSKRQENRIAGL